MVVLGALAIIGAIGFVVVPRIGFWLARHPEPHRATILPWISVLLFVVAWRLPNPDLARTSTFTQHAVGGGAACAVLGLYIALNTGLRSPLLRIGLAFTVAASMGTANELLELGYDQPRGTTLSADASWDLLANSIGAVDEPVATPTLHHRATKVHVPVVINHIDVDVPANLCRVSPGQIDGFTPELHTNVDVGHRRPVRAAELPARKVAPDDRNSHEPILPHASDRSSQRVSAPRR